MAQHDYTIANQGFPAFRSDLNDALAAIVSNNSGATEPTTMFAHQMWVDTAANPSVLKIRNADNDAWITVGTINQTGDTFTLTPAGGVVLPAGTSSLPSLTTTGDLNTGVFFPGADRVGVVTGGTQRLEVTSAGEVLVGGTTEVSSHQALSVQRTNATPVLSTFRNDTSIATGDLLGALQFFGNDTTSNTPTIHAQIYAVASGTHAAGDNPTDLVFGTTPAGSGTVAEIFRINSAGILELKNGSYPTLISSNYQNVSVGVATTIFTIPTGSSGVVFISSPDPSLSTTRYQANVYFGRGSGTPVIVTDENIDSLSTVAISLSGNDIQITSSNASMDRFVASAIYSYYNI